jgi:hypothetical protein
MEAKELWGCRKEKLPSTEEERGVPTRTEKGLRKREGTLDLSFCPSGQPPLIPLPTRH